VPATPAGLDALEELAAAGVTLNVTLIFTMRQYESARDAIWRGAQRCSSLERFKSLYSIFISRVDVYTEKHVPSLTPAALGLVGIVGVKRIWQANRTFWAERPTPLAQEIIFASTGTKKTERSALEVCDRACRERHPDESAGDQRRGGIERPEIQSNDRPTAPNGGARRNRR
jgi:transaldolase